MYKHFKNLNVLFWITIICSILIIAILFCESYNTINGITQYEGSIISSLFHIDNTFSLRTIAVVVMVVVITIEIYIFNWFANKDYNKMRKKAYEFYDYQEFHNFLSTAIRSKGKIKKTININLLLELATLEYTFGYLNEAKIILNTCNLIVPDKNYYYKTLLYYGYYRINLYEDNIDEMNLYYIKIRELYKIISQKNQNVYNSLDNYFADVEIINNLYRENFDYLQDKLEILFKNADNSSRKCFVKYLLANLYCKLGHNKQANEEMNYIIKNGDSLFVANWANEQIERV